MTGGLRQSLVAHPGRAMPMKGRKPQRQGKDVRRSAMGIMIGSYNHLYPTKRFSGIEAIYQNKINYKDIIHDIVSCGLGRTLWQHSAGLNELTPVN